jgi:hypothetical protein
VHEPLSESELRVLRYLPTNLTVPEIAGELYVSRNTVKTHMRNLYAKLGLDLGGVGAGETAAGAGHSLLLGLALTLLGEAAVIWCRAGGAGQPLPAEFAADAGLLEPAEPDR